MDKKIKALATFLGIDENRIKAGDCDSFNIGSDRQIIGGGIGEYSWKPDGREYLVLTDNEADERAKQEILATLWAFGAKFILDCCGLDSSESIVESLQDMQGRSCECCNDFIRALIEGTCGIDIFVNLAIESDGREHLIATYDGEENEQDEYFIYRVN